MAKRPKLESGLGQRPKVPERTYMQVAMTTELRAYLQEAADNCEMGFSAWARLRLLGAADKDCARKGRKKARKS